MLNVSIIRLVRVLRPHDTGMLPSYQQQPFDFAVRVSKMVSLWLNNNEKKKTHELTPNKKKCTLHDSFDINLIINTIKLHVTYHVLWEMPLTIHEHQPRFVRYIDIVHRLIVVHLEWPNYHRLQFEFCTSQNKKKKTREKSKIDNVINEIFVAADAGACSVSCSIPTTYRFEFVKSMVCPFFRQLTICNRIKPIYVWALIVIIIVIFHCIIHVPFEINYEYHCQMSNKRIS